MAIYKSDSTFGLGLRTAPSRERTILRAYTGRDISDPDAKVLWQRILVHKWYVSERLSRDVGFRVAAIDYVEHFYEPLQLTGNAGVLSVYGKVFMKRVGASLRRYFELKGDAIPI